MIKITNGSRIAVVTKGVFNEVYAPMGWKIAEEPKAEVPKKTEEFEEEFESEEVEIPLSEMKLSDLKAFAASYDIDISSARNKQEIRNIIRAEMEE
ncbi:MAG: hypothetical protein SPK83_04875 [Succinivibrio dextrinosolvens]|nr:hypothetical protein [Succinivibrio dextrinosolvens]